MCTQINLNSLKILCLLTSLGILYIFFAVEVRVSF